MAYTQNSIEKLSRSIDFNNNLTVFNNISIDVPYLKDNRNKSKIPQIGKTVTAQTFVHLPRGKGVNQAIGASRLGVP